MDELEKFKRSIGYVLNEYENPSKTDWLEGRRSAFAQVVKWLENDINELKQQKQLEVA